MRRHLAFFPILAAFGILLAHEAPPPQPKDQSAAELHRNFMIQQAAFGEAIVAATDAALASKDPAVKVSMATALQAASDANDASRDLFLEAIRRVSEAEPAPKKP